jgi:hypothetical protein
MLVGALFLRGPFPDFVLGVPASIQMPSSLMPQRRQVSYPQVMGTGSSYNISHSRPTSSPASSGTDSPIDPFPYMVPPTVSNVYTPQSQPSSSMADYGVIYPYTKSQNHQRYS